MTAPLPVINDQSDAELVATSMYDGLGHLEAAIAKLGLAESTATHPLNATLNDLVDVLATSAAEIRQLHAELTPENGGDAGAGGGTIHPLATCCDAACAQGITDRRLTVRGLYEARNGGPAVFPRRKRSICRALPSRMATTRRPMLSRQRAKHS